MTLLQTALDACVNLISRFGDREIAFGVLLLRVRGLPMTREMLHLIP